MSNYEKRLRILLVEEDYEFCRMFSHVFNRMGLFCVDTLYSGEKIREYVSECYYSVIIANKSLISSGDIEYTFSHNVNPDKHRGGTEIILLGDDIENDRMYRIGNMKPMYYLKKPIDCDFLKSLVLLINERQSLEADLYICEHRPGDIDGYILSILKSMGVPSSMKGHGFLVSAVKAAVIKPSLLEYVTKLLYPGVAKLHQSTAATVEKSIRHVIEAAWERGNMEFLDEVFGYTISRKRGKPTNSEFIAITAEYIRMRQPEFNLLELPDVYSDIVG
jgi:two-component system response regulator (stage 0 sporulation protein A)